MSAWRNLVIPSRQEDEEGLPSDRDFKDRLFVAERDTWFGSKANTVRLHKKETDEQSARQTVKNELTNSHHKRGSSIVSNPQSEVFLKLIDSHIDQLVRNHESSQKSRRHAQHFRDEKINVGLAKKPIQLVKKNYNRSGFFANKIAPTPSLQRSEISETSSDVSPKKARLKDAETIMIKKLTSDLVHLKQKYRNMKKKLKAAEDLLEQNGLPINQLDYPQKSETQMHSRSQSRNIFNFKLEGKQSKLVAMLESKRPAIERSRARTILNFDSHKSSVVQEEKSVNELTKPASTTRPMTKTCRTKSSAIFKTMIEAQPKSSTLTPSFSYILKRDLDSLSADKSASKRVSSSKQILNKPERQPTAFTNTVEQICSNNRSSFLNMVGNNGQTENQGQKSVRRKPRKEYNPGPNTGFHTNRPSGSMVRLTVMNT